MPFSNKFSGDYVYNIEYDAIDPNDLFDDFAMADLMEELPTINGFMAGSKLGDEELLHCDRRNDVAEKKKNKKRKLYDRSNLNKKIVDTMNKLAHTFTSGDLKALKEYMDRVWAVRIKNLYLISAFIFTRDSFANRMNDQFILHCSHHVMLLCLPLKVGTSAEPHSCLMRL